jgi:ferric-dicitrate binding protein FerR (iron transport regulator)
MRSVVGAREVRWAVAIVLSFVVVLSSSSAANAQQVGRATNLRTVAMQTPPNNRSAEVLRFAPIFRGALLATSPRGALEVTFADGSRVSMGGASTVVVDIYVYAGPGSGGQQVVRYTKGLFRFVSGRIPKDRVRIETPTVVIGIRGTVVRTIVDEDGTTTVGVDDGIAVVTSKQTGQSVTLNPGEKVTIKPAGEFGQIQLGKVEGCN